jgi:hypothetical protein
MLNSPIREFANQEAGSSMSVEQHSYRQILRSWSIMGGAADLNYLITLVRVKFAAVLLGPSGVLQRSARLDPSPTWGLAAARYAKSRARSAGRRGRRCAHGADPAAHLLGSRGVRVAARSIAGKAISIWLFDSLAHRGYSIHSRRHTVVRHYRRKPPGYAARVASNRGYCADKRPWDIALAPGPRSCILLVSARMGYCRIITSMSSPPGWTP